MRYGVAIGFVQQFMFPFAALFIAMVGYLRSATIPLTAIAAAYPLGLLFLAVYPILLGRGTQEESRDYFALVKGARYGTITVAIVSIPAFLILSEVLGERAIAYGFLSVGLGSLWLPPASAATLYGLVLSDSKEADSFLGRVSRSSFTFEAFVTFFLAIFLKRYELTKRVVRTAGFVIFLMVFYVSGWTLLSISGGFPATLFGLAVGGVIPLSSGLFFAKAVPNDSRRVLSDLLSDRLPHLTQYRRTPADAPR